MKIRHLWLAPTALILATATLSAWAVPPAPQGFQLGGDATRGKAVYARSCALCHGPAGKGDGAMAAGLDPKPQDFTSRAEMGKRSDWEIYLVIRDGGKAVGRSPQMLSYKSMLADPQIRDVAAYVRSLAK